MASTWAYSRRHRCALQNAESAQESSGRGRILVSAWIWEALLAFWWVKGFLRRFHDASREFFASIHSIQRVQEAQLRFWCFREYFRTGGQKHVSALVKARYNVEIQYDVAEKDIAHFKVINLLAAWVNVLSTTFWTIWHMYSDFRVLESLRTEVLQAVSTTVNEAEAISSLNVSKLITSCPLLMSTFQEVLRIRSTNTSLRFVMKDALIDNRYVLKNGTVLHMPRLVIHYDESVWGPKAWEFQAQRSID